MKFVLRLVGCAFLALSLLGFALAFIGELKYELSMASALMAIAFFTCAIYDEGKILK